MSPVAPAYFVAECVIRHTPSLLLPASTSLAQSIANLAALALYYLSTNCDLMGQYWKLVNLDKRREEFGGKLGEALCAAPGSSLNVFLRKLVFPPLENAVLEYKPGPVVNRRLRLPQRASHRISRHSKCLSDLPTELIDEVFGFLVGILDILVLSMSCQLVWSIGRRHIYAAMTQKANDFSWAGDRLMVVGDYLDNEDIPECLLTAEERTSLLDRPPAYKDRKPRLYDYPYEKASDWLQWLRYGGNDVKIKLGDRLGWSSDWHLFDVLVNYKPTEVPSYEEPPVLRNLTKRQYVVGNRLLQLRRDYQDSEIQLGDVTLGDLVYSRICWSSDPSANMRETFIEVFGPEIDSI
ncbi:hypothetical protein C8F01DRAFT_1066651 [Mycena amicta]|nr:hypothetical protein C8F01DRAFT_1066651 [Mycena amicta]